MLKTSENADPNYLAEVIKCPELKEHPNADKLQVLNIFGGEVIVAKGLYTISETLIYFPVESCISTKFLSWANLLDNPSLNADEKSRGFFSAKNDYSRVKAVRLRSVASEGFVFKASKIAEYYKIKESVFKVGETFDTVGEDVLVKKYVRGNSEKVNAPKKSRVPKWINTIIGIFPRPVRKILFGFVNKWFNRNQEGVAGKIISGHWKFNGKTQSLGRCMFAVNPEDEITISNKCHGAAGYFGNVLCNKKFNPFRSLLNRLGAKIKDKEYQFIYSSRTQFRNLKSGEFGEDVWGKAASKLYGKLPEGVIVMGEVLGYSSPEKTIQKSYDYGISKGETEMWVYRIIEKTEDGFREFSWREIAGFCDDRDIKTVPLYYIGKAKDLFDIPIDDNWSENFLAALKEKYLEKQCEFCKNKVPNEGVVLRNETKENKVALKFKSSAFVLQESAARDNNEEDPEEDG